MYQRLKNQPLGVPPNLEDGNASANVSIDDNDNGEFIEGVSEERQAKKKSREKRKRIFEEGVLHLKKRKIKLMEERLMKKSQADEDCVFLICLLPSIKKQLDDIQRLEIRIEFISNVIRTIPVSKNFSPWAR
jgi:hypothetical protein